MGAFHLPTTYDNVEVNSEEFSATLNLSHLLETGILNNPPPYANPLVHYESRGLLLLLFWGVTITGAKFFHAVSRPKGSIKLTGLLST